MKELLKGRKGRPFISLPQKVAKNQKGGYLQKCTLPFLTAGEVLADSFLNPFRDVKEVKGKTKIKEEEKP